MGIGSETRTRRLVDIGGGEPARLVVTAAIPPVTILAAGRRTRVGVVTAVRMQGPTTNEGVREPPGESREGREGREGRTVVVAGAVIVISPLCGRGCSRSSG